MSLRTHTLRKSGLSLAACLGVVGITLLGGCSHEGPAPESVIVREQRQAVLNDEVQGSGTSKGKGVNERDLRNIKGRLNK